MHVEGRCVGLRVELAERLKRLPPYLFAEIDRQKQACAALSAAIALYRAMEMTFWLPQAEAALAQVQ